MNKDGDAKFTTKIDFLGLPMSLCFAAPTGYPAHHIHNVEHYGNYCEVHLPAFHDWWTVFLWPCSLLCSALIFLSVRIYMHAFSFPPGPWEWYASLWREQIKGEGRITRAILTYSKSCTLTLERSSNFYGLGSFSTYTVQRLSYSSRCVLLRDEPQDTCCYFFLFYNAFNCSIKYVLYKHEFQWR